MKILFLTDNFPPESNAPASRTYEHCLEWLKKGAEVTVITCAPNFPKGEVFPGYKNKLYQTEDMDGIRVIRVWTYITENRGMSARILDYFSFSLSGSLAALFVKTDLIVATSPQLFTAFGGYWAAFFKRKPWIMEVRDLWPASIKAVGAMRESIVIKLLEQLVYFLYRRATRIVVVTDSFKERLILEKVEPGKIDVIKNGVLLDQFQPMPKDRELLLQHNLEGKFVVAYIGTHGMAHNLSFILDCAQKVDDEDIHFLFVGAGAMRSRLIRKAEELELANVTFVDAVPKKQVASYISICDVALINLRKTITFTKVIPSKIFENAAMGKPILLGVAGEAERIVKFYEAGLCFEPENGQAFLEQLMQLKQNRELYERCHKGGLVLAEAFDRRKLAGEMYTILEMTAGQATVDSIEQELSCPD